jgi:hypothetical protein
LERVLVEQIKPEEIESLVLEVEQRAVDSAFVAREMIRKQAHVGLRRSIGCAPVSRPVDPWRFLADESSVAADNSHIVVDTGWWIFGKKRLIPAGAVTAVDHDAKTVTVSLTKDQIKDAPDYDENALLDDVSRDAYDNYYGPYGG